MAVQLIARPAPTRSASSPIRRSAISSCRSAPRVIVNRNDFECWGQMPDVDDQKYNAGHEKCRKFGKAIWDITGKGNDVDFVFEHPGEQTFPVSVLRREARRHGRVLRRHHRLQPHHGCPLRVDAPEAHQGSHFANLLQASQANQLVIERRIDPACRGLRLGRHPQGAPRCGRTSTSPATWRCWSPPSALACARSRTPLED